jgi:putative transcriptional regulator
METPTDEFSLARNKLARDIIAEIVMADNSDSVIKKWRGIFKISQKHLAAELGITSSVVSDYESGRRKSPGIKVVRKYVDTLLAIDAKRGGGVIRSFAKPAQPLQLSNAILDIKEFSSGLSVTDFCNRISAKTLNRLPEREIYGYTLIDSLKAITELSFPELIRLYGATTQRALIFTKVSTGKAPLVAIKLTNLHPALVVLHGLDAVDDVAVRIADAERIPLAVCRLESVERIVESLAGME